VQETASNAAGPGSPASSEPTATILPPPPQSTAPPTISGSAVQGQTLTESHGTWTNNPTGFAYQWLRCDGAGINCGPISGATGQTYVLAAADVGHTLRVQEEASNGGGAGAPATSGATAAVQAQTTATFGKTNVGASADKFVGNRKRVNGYSLPVAGAVSKLSIYLAPTTKAGEQVMKGIIYSDSAGAPQQLQGVTGQLTFKSTDPATWYDLVFASPVKLAAGTYWIGVITGGASNVAGYRYANVAGSRAFNANGYASGPTTFFGSVSTDLEQMSLYATYTPGG
jgi:hypothetical protein